MQQGLMSLSEQKMLKAQTEKKFLELNHKERTALFNKICLAINIRVEVPIELVQIISDDIRNKFPSLRSTELQLAMNMNKYGEFETKFEHYQAFSPDFVCNVLLEYYKHRNKLLQQFNKVDHYREKTDEEKKQLHDNFLELILQKFEEFKKSGAVEIQLNKPVFEYLWSKRIMRFSPAKADEYRSRATRQHIKNLRENPLNLQDPNVRDELRRFAEGQTPTDHSLANINWLCRMFAINDFFAECVRDGVELRERLGAICKYLKQDVDK